MKFAELMNLVGANGGWKEFDRLDYFTYAGVEGPDPMIARLDDEREAVMDSEIIQVFDANGSMIAAFEYKALEVAG